MEHLELNIKGQGGGESVDIPLIRITAFGFQEELVRLLFRELHKLIFNGGAVARANAFNLAAIKRRAVEVIMDNLTGHSRCLGHPAGDLIAARSPSGEALAALFHVEHVGFLPGIMEGKKGGGEVAGLLFALAKING